MSEYIKGVLLTAVGVLILSFDGLLIRLIAADSFDLLFWRGLLMSVAIAFILRLQKSTSSWLPTDPAALRSSFFMVVCTITFVMAINLSSVANVLVIISSQPLFAALFGWIFLREMPQPVTWLAIVLSMIGVGWVLVGSWSEPNFMGDVLALICCLALAAKFVNDRAVSHTDMTPALISSGIALALISFFAGSPMALTGNDWWYMIILCLVVSPLAFSLITIGPMRIPAAEVGMLMLLETAVGPLWVWLFLNEEPGSAAMQGGSIVIGTLLLHSLYQWRHHRLKTTRDLQTSP
ncbi:MAG: DMT family transporter [Gammaproteobacteria bacterium]|nr:DMT family transporter [Gammaproteobacteria bacterium]